LKAWPVLGVTLMQLLLFSAHWFIYRTWIAFWYPLGPSAALALRSATLVLAFSFIVAALLSFRFSNFLVAAAYKIAAVWLGFLNYFFWASCVGWLACLALRFSPLAPELPRCRPLIVGMLFALATLACLYGLLNARWIRIRRIPVKLPHLPASWRGRKALVLSDLHLGNINGRAFSRRIVSMVHRLAPDIVFIPGDLFDGTKADLDRLIEPFRQLSPPFGIYFVTGNHEEFGRAEPYIEAVTRAGIRVLANEQVVADGLVIAGIPHRDSTYPIRVRAALEALRLDPAQASILLNHEPTRLPIAEQAGLGLQLSGHTHGGQIFPFTWLTRRVFGKFTHGLHRFGALQVYTSTGAGTWGPPMRVGTHSEIALLQFE